MAKKNKNSYGNNLNFPKIKTNFGQSAAANAFAFEDYYYTLMDLAVSSFKYDNMPDSVDVRFLEITVFNQGYALFFKDEVMGFLGLPAMVNGVLDVYNLPVERRAYAANGYQNTLYKSNSVLIFNNFLHQPSSNMVYYYASRLWDYDQTIDINIKSQKTPILITCEENEKLTMENLYKQYDGNAPIIKGYKTINGDTFKVLKTDAPFVAPQLYELRTNIWNECLTKLGIANISQQKKERMISDEVQKLSAGAFAYRRSRLDARQQAIEQINKMFDLDIKVEFDDGVEEMAALYGDMINQNNLEIGGDDA